MCISLFEGILFLGFFSHSPYFGFALLQTIATNVSHLTAIVTLHLSQAPFAHLLLSLVVSFPWFEGRFGRIVNP